jgi:hypothetical protein
MVAILGSQWIKIVGFDTHALLKYYSDELGAEAVKNYLDKVSEKRVTGYINVVGKFGSSQINCLGPRQRKSRDCLCGAVASGAFSSLSLYFFSNFIFGPFVTAVFAFVLVFVI